MTNAIRPGVAESWLANGEAQTHRWREAQQAEGWRVKAMLGRVRWLAMERWEGRVRESGRPERGPPVFIPPKADEEPPAQEAERP
ncbi:MAG: hypothetical protein JSU86_18520 [Phycisphaerales bacterium]|nr:MAG: hypothetical protein JSU86_18520 [Phycisphaerales bacterium]